MSVFACKNEVEQFKKQYLASEIPNDIPLEFKAVTIPDDQRIHKGVFSPDLSEYYYTISDKNFENFDVYVIEKKQKQWSEPKKAFFNSKYDDHGMSFSPDGKTLYFSSTRPVNKKGVNLTWHLWKSNKFNSVWTEPVFVDIPNLRDKLVSHPTVTSSGTLYFHSSNPDYSEMDLYHSKLVNGKFEDAEKIQIPSLTNIEKCTPYISPDEDFLIFATVGNQLDLYISFNEGQGIWTKTRILNNKINNSGQGNPFVTPDQKFLFFTAEDPQRAKWNVKWVRMVPKLK